MTLLVYLALFISSVVSSDILCHFTVGTNFTNYTIVNNTNFTTIVGNFEEIGPALDMAKENCTQADLSLLLGKSYPEIVVLDFPTQFSLSINGISPQVALTFINISRFVGILSLQNVSVDALWGEVSGLFVTQDCIMDFLNLQGTDVGVLNEVVFSGGSYGGPFSLTDFKIINLQSVTFYGDSNVMLQAVQVLLSNCSLHGSLFPMEIQSLQIQISNSSFVNNQGYEVGALDILNAGENQAVIITDSIFDANSATSSEPNAAPAIRLPVVAGFQAIFTNCTFYCNYANVTGQPPIIFEKDNDNADSQVAFTHTQKTDNCSLSCPEGKYSKNGLLGCQNCVPGTISNSTNAQICIPCSPGSHANGSGLSLCSLCAGGSYASKPGSPTCTLCSAGSFSDEGAVNCTLCSSGFSDEGATSCTDCGFWRDEASRCANLSTGGGAIVGVASGVVGILLVAILLKAFKCIPCKKLDYEQLH